MEEGAPVGRMRARKGPVLAVLDGLLASKKPKAENQRLMSRVEGNYRFGGGGASLLSKTGRLSEDQVGDVLVLEQVDERGEGGAKGGGWPGRTGVGRREGGKGKKGTRGPGAAREKTCGRAAGGWQAGRGPEGDTVGRTFWALGEKGGALEQPSFLGRHGRIGCGAGSACLALPCLA